MATSATLFTVFPKPFPIRFYPTNAPIDPNQNFVQFDQASYIDTRLPTQTAKPYTQKNTYADIVTVMVHTQANSLSTPFPYPDLVVLDSAGNVVIDLVDPAYVRGAQQIAGNTFTDPESGETIQLNTYCWEFTWGQFLDVTAGESGLYYLRLRNYSPSPATYLEHKSEPILVFDSHPGTVLLQGQNNTNRNSQDVIVNGWDDSNYNPKAWLRVEGWPEQYNPKGIYSGYIGQDYQASQLKAQNFRSFMLNIGAVSAGVPDYVYEKASEIALMDDFKVDYKSFIYDVEGSDSNIKKMWQFTDRKLSQLGWGSLPIREKYNSQNATFVVLPIPDLLLWWSPWRNPDVDNPSPGSFMKYAIPRFTLINSGAASVYPATNSAIYDETDEDTVIAAINALLPGSGLTGTAYRNDTVGSPTRGQILYEQGFGETVTLASVIPVLYRWYSPVYQTTNASNLATIVFNGAGSKQIIDWSDGSTPDYYASLVTTDFNATHDFAAVDTYVITIFHNNVLEKIVVEDGTDVNLIEFAQGELPASLQTFRVDAATAMTTPASFAPLLPAVDSLQTVVVKGTPITAFSDLFSMSFTAISFIAVNQNQLTVTEVDASINGFVANSSDCLDTPGGTFDIHDQTPLAAPTAASLAARTAITTALWTLSHD